MSEDEMDDAIAEIVDWRPTGPSWYVDKYDRPKYSRDLNVMHEAEETLTDAQFEEYFNELEFQHPLSRHARKRRHVCSATARQRAEAFLRTFNKWKD